MNEPAMTSHTQTVLAILLGRRDDGERDPAALQRGVYGLELSRRSGLPNGTLFPLLQRLRQAGWVERYWEEDEIAEAEGRPRRRFYRLTTAGAERAPLALARASAAAGSPPQAWRTRPAEGSAG